MTYGFLPFAILPLFVSIDRLDDALVAAARDLYASGRAAFIHVTLPLTMPGIVAASILTFIPAIGDFVTPDLLGGARDDDHRQDHPEPVPGRARLAGRVRPWGSCSWPPPSSRSLAVIRIAAPRGPRLMHRERNPLLSAYALLVYVFLFLPIVVLILFSFNDSEGQLRLDAASRSTGIPSLFPTRTSSQALVDHAPGGGRRGHRLDGARDAAGHRPGPAAHALRGRPVRDAHPAADGRARDHPGHQPAALLRRSSSRPTARWPRSRSPTSRSASRTSPSSSGPGR